MKKKTFLAEVLCSDGQVEEKVHLLRQAIKRQTDILVQVRSHRWQIQHHSYHLSSACFYADFIIRYFSTHTYQHAHWRHWRQGTDHNCNKTYDKTYDKT